MSYLNILLNFWVGCKIWALFFQPGEVECFTFLPNEYRVPKIKKTVQTSLISVKSNYQGLQHGYLTTEEVITAIFKVISATTKVIL